MNKPPKSTGPRKAAVVAPQGHRELIVVARHDAGLRARGASVTSTRGAATDALAAALAASGAVMRPLFGASEDAVRRATMATPAGTQPAELYYEVVAEDHQLDALAERLRAVPTVAAAYVKPAGEPPLAPPATMGTRSRMAALFDGDVPQVTPDFTSRQGYLEAAPGGIDARYAWTLAGGRGAGVRIIDCEWGWRFTHEDLTQRQGGVISGTATTQLDYENHGTAVLGEISGDENDRGVIGIASDAEISASAFSIATATAIRNAADRLSPGDLLLLEIHRAGPAAPNPPQGQLGYIAAEWWPDDFAAIRYAVEKGIIVVEAAGNGYQDLDDPIYSTPAAGFPVDWTNPFDPAHPSSGAVLVGAGAPPPGTHGQDWGPDRSRLDFSNYGARVDVQGWGREVTTTGYGDLQDSANLDLRYTDSFSGTSSASPIVVGALACLQGVLRAQGLTPLTPARARELLRSTGSPQQDAPDRPATQRIGNRPDLRQLVAAATATVGPWTGTQFSGSVGAGDSYRGFTRGWPAHWQVVWTVIPTTVAPGAAQLGWTVQVERQDDAQVTYWITVQNLTVAAVDFDVRYAVLGA